MFCKVLIWSCWASDFALLTILYHFHQDVLLAIHGSKFQNNVAHITRASSPHEYHMQTSQSFFPKVYQSRGFKSVREEDPQFRKTKKKQIAVELFQSFKLFSVSVSVFDLRATYKQ